jgi:hypothetical protein
VSDEIREKVARLLFETDRDEACTTAQTWDECCAKGWDEAYLHTADRIIALHSASGPTTVVDLDRIDVEALFIAITDAYHGAMEDVESSETPDDLHAYQSGQAARFERLRERFLPLTSVRLRSSEPEAP